MTNPVIPQFEETRREQATNFRAVVKDLAVPWLANDTGYRFLYSLAIQMDTIAEYFRIGALQSFPDDCQEAALSHIGSDYRIRRGASETSDSYRTRLKQALLTWKTAGLPTTLLGQIAAYFSPTPPKIRYVTTGWDASGNQIADWWTLDTGVYSYQRVTPTNWNWDGVNGNYRFWIILYLPLLSPWNWDDGSYWDQPGLLWDYKGGAFIEDLRALVSDWKCAGTHCTNLILASDTTNRAVRWGEFAWGDGTLWGDSTPGFPMFDPSNPPGNPMPDGTWGDPANRDPNAQYFDEG